MCNNWRKDLLRTAASPHFTRCSQRQPLIPGEGHREQLRKTFFSESIPLEGWKAVVNDPTVLQALEKTASFSHRGDNRTPGHQIFIPNATKRVSVEGAEFDWSKAPAPPLPFLTVCDFCSLRNGGPKTLLWSKRIKLFLLWHLWLGTFQNVLADAVGYHWNTTSSSQYWSTLSPSACKDSCFMSCYKTCQKPTQMASEEKSGDLRIKRTKWDHSESI